MKKLSEFSEPEISLPSRFWFSARCPRLHVWFIFDPDDVGFNFLCNIGDLWDYKESNPGRYCPFYFSLPCSKEPTTGPSSLSTLMDSTHSHHYSMRSVLKTYFRLHLSPQNEIWDPYCCAYNEHYLVSCYVLHLVDIYQNFHGNYCPNTQS
jgi:hypothetical protein